MQVRVNCPACGDSHVLNVPEGTIHMTCARTGRLVELTLTAGGDVKARLVEPADDVKQSQQN